MVSEASSVWPIGAKTRMRLPLWRWAGALLLIVWASVSISAQEPLFPTEAPKAGETRDETQSEESNVSPLEYIMVFGPADRQAEWEPKDHRELAPNEFREMVRRAHAGLPPAIRSAHYEAKFENDELVDGRAQLDIEHLGPVKASLPLTPCNLAIGTAGWADRDGETARLGLGPRGRFELRVDHGGRLEFDWSLKGTSGALGGVDFEVRLPPCPSSWLHLTLPEDRVPVVPGGILSPLKKPPEKGMRTWQIVLGGVNRVSLRIAPEGDPEGHSQFTELRERIAYNLGPGGLELTAALRFDVLDQPLSHLELLVPEELNLVAVRDGDTPIPWSETPVRRLSAKRVVIDPESALQGLGRELTLKALSPIQLEKPWRLPGVKVQGVHWCESVASLTVQHPLRLKDVTSDNGRISQVRSQLARRTKDAVELQLFSADAQIDVVLRQEQLPPRIDYGVTVEMSGGQLAGRQTVRLETDEGEHFQIVGNLAPFWVVDSIQADPGVIADWRVPGQLFIDLARPLSSDSPVEFVVSARRLESTDEKLYSSRDMIPLEFVSGKVGTALVALHAPAPYQLEFSGAEGLVQREAEDLSIREQQLVSETSGGKIYLHDGRDKDLRIQVRPRPLLYSAAIDVSVDLSGKQATESYVFGIDPESRLGDVAVEVLKRPGMPLRWDLGAGDEAHLVVGSQAGGDSEVDRWELRLRPSRSEFFELRATRDFVVEDGAAIGLTRLPDAAKQEGRLSIRVSGEDGVRIENRSLTPVLSAALQDSAEVPRAAYHYDPGRSLTSGTPPMVLRVDDSASSLPKAWVWQCQLESRLEPTGEGRHAASYRVESVGAPFFYLSLPSAIGVDLIDSVEVDGRRTALESPPTGEPAILTVRLNTSRRFHEVTVCYRTIGPRWASVQPLQIPVPEPRIPVLKRNWIVWLPPGREVMETEGMFRLSSGSSQWPTNVLGPVGRGAGVAPLDPFAGGFWQWGSEVEPDGDLALSATAEDDTGRSSPQDGGGLAAFGDGTPGFEPRDTIGWGGCEIDLTESEVATVLVVDRNLYLCGLWVCFLVVAFLAWTVAIRYPALSVLSIVSFFLGAAYLPDFWGPWLSAGFWGGVAGLLIRLVAIRRVRNLGRVVATRTVSETGSAAGPLVGCLLALSIVAEGSAQPTEAETASEAPALILAPVGSDDKPTGGNYFVPEPFYMELQRRAQRIAEEVPAWLLEEADYQARLNWQATGEPLTVTEFTADFVIDVIRPNEEVEILLGTTPGNWQLEAAWRDGRRIDDRITWESDQPIVFLAESAGSCHLRLQLAPIPGYGVVRNGFQLTVPPLATSRLELTIPADATRVEVPTATGQSFIRQGQSKIAVDLGPVETLAVKWQPTGRASSGKGTQVDELIWLNLALGGALVEAQFHFDRGQDFDELVLTLDPRLEQRGSYEVEGATLDDVEEASEPSRGGLEVQKGLPQVRHRLSLTEVIGEKVIVRGQFVVRDASGVGSLRVPSLRSVGYDVSRRWVAATVDPRLHHEHSTLGRVSTIGLSEFAEAWIGEVELPVIALELDDEQASFGMNTWPKPSQSSAQWKTSVGYGLSETAYRFRADVDTNEGYLFQHRLAVPPELEIDDLTATASDQPRAIQWTRPSQEEIVVLFDEAVSGGHSLQLRGRIPAKGERVDPLQRIVLHGVENETGTIDIYRQHEAIVELESVEGLIQHGLPVGTVLEEDLGRGVSRWEVDGLGPVKASVRVEPNDPKVLVRQQIISLRQTSDGWTVDVDCELEVEQGKGIVDKICLETSELWPGPYVVDPGLTMEVDEDRRELVLRPPVRDEIKFRVSGPLVAKVGGGTSVPRIRLRNVDYSDQTERLVVLPVGPAPPIRWHVLGLTRTDLPSRFVARPGITWNAYRVQQDDFLATIRPSPDKAQIHLADIRLGWDAKGECRGVALYDLEAGERDTCILRLPDGWRLVAAANRGVPISPRRGEENSWTIALARTILPQRLEFVYAGRISRDGFSPAGFDVFPKLEDLPVRRAIWTLAGPGESSAGIEGEPIVRERAAMVRLRNVTTLINRASLNPEVARDEEATWYRGWLAEWMDARREAETAVVFASRDVPARAERAELETLDLEQLALAERLDAKDEWGRLTTSSTSRITPGAMWDDMGFGISPKYYYSPNGFLPSVVHIDSPRAKQGMRVALSPVLYVSAVLLVLFVAWATGRLHRWPHLYGVGMGICWWLWLWPSVLGLFLTAVCLLAVVRSGWRRPRSSGSAIVRLSVSGRP